MSTQTAIAIKIKSEEKCRPFVKEIPDWFNLANYKDIYQLDLERWINELYLRQMIQGGCKRLTLTGICHDFSLPEVHASAQQAFVKPMSNREAMLVVEAVKESYDIPSDVWLAPSGLQLATTEQPDLLEWYQQATLENPALKHRSLTHPYYHAAFRGVISVDLNAPDTILIKAFKHWLDEQRTQTSSLRKNVFTHAVLQRWAVNQVLPYIDLAYWAKLNAVQIPHWLMGEALFPGNAQGDKVDRIRKTTEKSAQQVMSQDNLWAMVAQLSFSTGKVLDLDFAINGACLKNMLA